MLSLALGLALRLVLGLELGRPVTRGVGVEAPLENFSHLLEKCVGYSLKLLEIVQKIGPLSDKYLPLLVSQAGYGPGVKFSVRFSVRVWGLGFTASVRVSVRVSVRATVRC